MKPFDLERFTPYRLNVAAGTFALLLDRLCLQPAGITVAQWRVLSRLGGAGPCAQGVLVKTAPMDKITVTRAVGALTAQGYVISIIAPGDRRARLLDLTEKGRLLFRNLAQTARELEQETMLLGGIQDQAGFTDQLARIEAAARTLLRTYSEQGGKIPDPDGDQVNCNGSPLRELSKGR